MSAAIPNADGRLCLVGYLARTHRRPWTTIRGGWCVCDECAREWDWDSTLPEPNKPTLEEVAARVGDKVVGDPNAPTGEGSICRGGAWGMSYRCLAHDGLPLGDDGLCVDGRSRSPRPPTEDSNIDLVAPELEDDAAADDGVRVEEAAAE